MENNTQAWSYFRENRIMLCCSSTLLKTFIQSVSKTTHTPEYARGKPELSRRDKVTGNKENMDVPENAPERKFFSKYIGYSKTRM